jgi:hypothetical protein
MKKIIALFLLASLALFSACGSDTEVVTVVDENGEEVQVELPLGKELDPADVVVTASAVLTDASGYGFDYSPDKVLDTDYSTAWCVSNNAIPTLSLEFPEETLLGTVGIMPGFGRDEDIFMKNNHIKYLEVWYDDQPEALEEFYFEDSYEMQFFQMPAEPVTKVNFKITQVYRGSLYNDTCVAEVDFWSDWVENQDAAAAYEFYTEEKAEEALQPVGIESLSMTTGEYLTDCGAVSSESPYYLQNGKWLNFLEGPIAVSAKLDEYGFEGAEVTVNWVMTGSGLPGDTSNYPQTIESKTLEANACENGDLYVYDTFPLTAGSFDVELFYGDNLIGSASYSIAQ